jgi:hypothetical protein
MKAYRSVMMVLLLASIAGCGQRPQPAKPGQPPIAFSFRKSQIPTQGMVAGVQNKSSTETLTNFVIKVSAPQENGTRSHKVNSPVEPQDTITVGWIELDGWKLKPNDKISVSCEQYSGDATAVVPEP